ncbi:MAG: Os1348 family NHLP clan protein [Planctomycetota bacterium]
MSEDTVKNVIGLLISDASFRAEFRRNPEKTLASRALELDDEAIARLVEFAKAQEQQGCEVLDDRIKRRSDDLI